MFFYAILFILVFQLLLITIVIRYKLNKINEKKYNKYGIIKIRFLSKSL
jgi:hypothetical protein